MKILNFCTLLPFQSPLLKDKFKNDTILTISPLQGGLNDKFVKCEIGSLSYVLAMICSKTLDIDFFKDMDLGHLSGESNIGEEELPSICEFIKDVKFCVVSSENFQGVNGLVLKEMINLLSLEFGFKILDLSGEIISLKGELSELEELDNFDGATIFTHSKFDEFRGGEYFAAAAKLRDKSKVKIKTISGVVGSEFILDKSLKGTIGFLGNSKLKWGFELLKLE